MPGVLIRDFGGTNFKVSDRLLPIETATMARNCRLWSGDIAPMRKPRMTHYPLPVYAPPPVPPMTPDVVLPSTNILTIFPLETVWLTWPFDVDVVRGFVKDQSSQRIYYTGDGNPKMTTLSLALSGQQPYPQKSYEIGVPAPTRAPNVALIGGTGSGEPLARSYVYTYVDTFGDEGPPSPPSAIVTAKDGERVQVNGFTPPPTNGSPITNIRIYRTSTGTKETLYLFVAEIKATDIGYQDAILEKNLVEELPSKEYFPPPSSLRGLNSSPAGVFSGFVDNTLYYSEPYLPHAWPEKYARPLDYPIVGCAWFGTNQVVCTTGPTYLVTGSDPSLMRVEKLPDPYPCVSKRSIVTTDAGVIYATHDGLVRVGYDGVKLVTFNEIMREQWVEMFNPQSITGTTQTGKYVGFYSTHDGRRGSFIFDYLDRATGELAKSRFVLCDTWASAAYSDPSLPLRVVIDNKLYVWDDGDEAMTWEWKSKRFVSPQLITFAVAKVIVDRRDNDPKITSKVLNFEMIDEDGKVWFSKDVKSDEPFRLPAFPRKLDLYFRVTGQYTVREVHIASGMGDLTEGNAL